MRFEKLKFLFIIFLLVFAFPAGSSANPGFARRYGFSCSMCHSAFPKLNDFGETFAKNGYRLSAEEAKDKSIDTGDPFLNLLPRVPLSLRLDTYARWRKDTETNYDLETPYALKLLSGAPLSRKISYYFYFLISERGEIASIEDGFLYFNNIWRGEDLDLIVGQFSLSDLIFPRELRLTFQDYSIYSAAVSKSGFNLKYDRGVMLEYSKGVWEISLGAINGQGIEAADRDKNFDSDNFKHLFGRAGTKIKGMTIGFYGYSGREKAEGRNNVFYRLGPDINLSPIKELDIFANFLWGEDSNAEFNPDPKRVKINGGFLGINYFFQQRTLGNILYNRIYSKEKPELKEDTLTFNFTHYVLRNFKGMLEYTYDLQKISPKHPKKTDSFTLGMVTAF